MQQNKNRLKKTEDEMEFERARLGGNLKSTGISSLLLTYESHSYSRRLPAKPSATLRNTSVIFENPISGIKWPYIWPKRPFRASQGVTRKIHKYKIK